MAMTELMLKYLGFIVLFTSREKYFGRPHKKSKGSRPYHVTKTSMVKFKRTWPTLKKGKTLKCILAF